MVDFMFVYVAQGPDALTKEEVDFYTRLFLGYIPREVRTHRLPLVEVMSNREKVSLIPRSMLGACPL